MATSNQPGIDRQPTVFKVGILEVQGAFLEHKIALQKAKDVLDSSTGLLITEVRGPEDVTSDMDGLIIPGGESTAISLFLKRNKMEDPLRDWIAEDSHVTWGTCAGMILLSKVTENKKIGGQETLGVMDTDVSRNFFGRQVQSFEAPVQIEDAKLKTLLKKDTYPGVFIRAPAVVKILSSAVNILATLKRPSSDDVIVAVEQGNVFATAFHPELTDDSSWHQYFLKLIEQKKSSKTNNK